jgi:hypothetical protein
LGYAVKHQSTVLIAADPLDTKEVQAVLTAPDPATQFAAIGVVINDSFAKCEQFTNGLVMIENTTNTGFDMTTTLLSALATAFRPLSTVHGLTAGASVSSGWKTAIDSDIYSKASASSYVQIIQGTYYKDMPAYLATLEAQEKQDKASIEPAFALGNIRRIHIECSLAAAQTKLSAAVAGAANAPPLPAVAMTSKILKVAINGSAKKDDDLTLTANDSSNKPIFSNPLSYVVKTGDTASTIAKAFYGELTGNGAAATEAKKAGISATLLPPPLDDSIILIWPTVTAIQWTASKQDAEELTLSDWTGPSFASPVVSAGATGGQPAKK